MELNGKAQWFAIIGVMLTMAGIIWRGGNTVGQIEQTNENQGQAIQQLEKRVRTIVDVLVKQARGKAERDSLQRQIEQLEREIDRLQGRDGPHQQDGGPDE